MSHYYYADAVTNEAGYIDPVGEIPPRVQSLKYDDENVPPRFVLRLHDDHHTPDPAWTEKTEAEVEADYPGLLGGG